MVIKLKQTGKNWNEETKIQNRHGKSVQTFDLTTKQRFYKTLAKLNTTNPKWTVSQCLLNIPIETNKQTNEQTHYISSSSMMCQLFCNFFDHSQYGQCFVAIYNDAPGDICSDGGTLQRL